MIARNRGASAIPLTLVLGLLGLLAAGCAHTAEEPRTPASDVREGRVVEVPAEREVVGVATPPEAGAEARDDANRARPRLSRTVTLGQGSDELTYTAPVPGGGNVNASGPNVVINNNVVVSNTATAISGGYGGYGGYRGGGYRPSSGSGGGGSRSGWGTSGWEGAQRTAAPGRAPGIGGNWPSAPSYGPASMR